MSIIVDQEFKDLIPPLTEDEFKQLEENCVKDGIRDPIVVWPQGDGNDILVDGHNRWKIAAEHAGIPFQIRRKEFESREAVIAWIIRNQFGRRNLSAYDRSVLALKLKPLMTEKAKENQGTRTDICQKSDRSPIDTKKELAKVAGVSHDTIHKVEKIEAEASESTKNLVRQGKLSINQAYNSTFPKRPDPVKQAKREHEEFQEKKQEQSVVDFQEVKLDRINQEIINNALTREIIKIIKDVTSFGLRHRSGEIEKLGNELTKDYQDHLISELQKCCKVITRIQVDLLGG